MCGVMRRVVGGLVLPALALARSARARRLISVRIGIGKSGTVIGGVTSNKYDSTVMGWIKRARRGRGCGTGGVAGRATPGILQSSIL